MTCRRTVTHALRLIQLLQSLSHPYIFLSQKHDTDMFGTGLLFWYSEEGTGRGRSLPRLLLAVPNVTAHPSTALF